MSKISIWSHRFTVARGWKWVHERDVSEQESYAWITKFNQEEPKIKFVLIGTTGKSPGE